MTGRRASRATADAAKAPEELFISRLGSAAMSDGLIERYDEMTH